MKRTTRWAAALVGALAAMAPLPAIAQSSLQVPVQFDFVNPGARSLALGGAFVGLADDATAALLNPAGLIELTRPEVSVEGRVRRFVQPMLIGGRLSGVPTGLGEDTTNSLLRQDISSLRTAPTFGSFVYPRGRWRIAGFGYDLIHLSQDFSARGTFQNRGFDTRDTAFSATRSLAVSGAGLSAAVQLPRVWLGGGLLVQRFRLGFEFDRYLHESFFGAPDPTQGVFHFSQAGRGTAAGVIVGAMVPLPRAKIGVAFKRAPRFGFSSFSGGLVGTQQRTDSTFKVPDTLAIGASSALTPRLSVTAEYTWVRHSQLLDDYVGVLVNQGESRTRADRFSINDGHELHGGVEYLMPIKWRPALRAGLWFDPDHSVRYRPTPANDLLDERIAANLSSGRDLWHYTAGTMIAVHPRADVSAGIDVSARSTIVSLSTIVRF